MLNNVATVVKAVATSPVTKNVAANTAAFVAGYKAAGFVLSRQIRRAANTETTPPSVKL